MQLIKYPTEQEKQQIVTRPVYEQAQIDDVVTEILHTVKQNGDKALRKYALKFDKSEITDLMVSEKERNSTVISAQLEQAMLLAIENIRKFHAAQQTNFQKIDTQPGVTCWQKSVAIEKVGLYIPGGTAPLFSTVLMLAVPAKIAACREIVLCTPPDKNGNIHPAILAAAKLAGVTKVFKAGGAQAIAAMAYGTESIPKVNKIFGPGNQYVTRAKELVQMSGTAIDMPAGPSEVLIIADQTANPAFVAADLLSQAEHGTDSQVILLSDNQNVIKQTLLELDKQLKALPRREIATASLQNSSAVLLKNIDECLALSNEYAPEHLIIASENADSFLDKITNAGSVFVGNYSCESAGDYASGTNHTLPTNGFAKSYSGVTLSSFQKQITFQKLSATGIKNIGAAIEIMAAEEQLLAHKNAVTLRLKALENGN